MKTIDNNILLLLESILGFNGFETMSLDLKERGFVFFLLLGAGVDGHDLVEVWESTGTESVLGVQFVPIEESGGDFGLFIGGELDETLSGGSFGVIVVHLDVVLSDGELSFAEKFDQKSNELGSFFLVALREAIKENEF